jgi:hypothetical protein
VWDQRGMSSCLCGKQRGICRDPVDLAREWIADGRSKCDVDPFLTMRCETVAGGCHPLPIALFELFLRPSHCDRLPPAASSGLHKCSIFSTRHLVRLGRTSPVQSEEHPCARSRRSSFWKMPSNRSSSARARGGLRLRVPPRRHLARQRRLGPNARTSGISAPQFVRISNDVD